MKNLFFVSFLILIMGCATAPKSQKAEVQNAITVMVNSIDTRNWVLAKKK
ncbi:MAG: hypothetical protein HRT44_01360, partial [Bdellovibrionales bacterium]|nr:hypothetical protein [Bdellovibrionales bacterium]